MHSRVAGWNVAKGLDTVAADSTGEDWSEQRRRGLGEEHLKLQEKHMVWPETGERRPQLGKESSLDKGNHAVWWR